MRRSSQERRQSERYFPLDFISHFAFSITDDDLINVKEVVDSEDSDLWKKAIVEEMDALDKNEAWNLVQLPAGRKDIVRKWLFKNNLNGEVQIPLGSKGIFSGRGNLFWFFLVAKLTSIRFLLSIVSASYLEVESMDVR